jgi:hypothetical protein
LGLAGHVPLDAELKFLVLDLEFGQVRLLH